MKNKLIKFLKENHAWEEFKTNFYHEGRTDINQIINGDKYQIILDAFYWDKTTEGHNFWDNIYKKWLGILGEEETT